MLYNREKQKRGNSVFYVYRFLNSKGVIIYVGKTNNLKNRMGQHFGNAGHLSEEAYKEVEIVEYIVETSKADMDIKELYYINKWKPKHNMKNKQSEQMTLKLDTSLDNWKDINDIYNKEKIESLERKIKELERENNSQKKKIQFYENEFRNYKEMDKKIKEQSEEINTLRTSMQFTISNLHFNDDNEELFSFDDVKTLYSEGLNTSFFCYIFSTGREVFKFIIFQKNKSMFCKNVYDNTITPLDMDCFKYGASNLSLISMLSKMNFKIESKDQLVARDMLRNAKRKHELEKKKQDKFRSLVSREQMDRILEVNRPLSEFEDFLWNAKENEDVDTIIKEWLLSKASV